MFADDDLLLVIFLIMPHQKAQSGPGFGFDGSLVSFFVSNSITANVTAPNALRTLLLGLVVISIFVGFSVKYGLKRTSLVFF